MSEIDEDVVIRTIREHGTVSSNPDFQPGFELPNQWFDFLRNKLTLHEWHGQPYFLAGRFNIIREEPYALAKSLREIYSEKKADSEVVQPI